MSATELKLAETLIKASTAKKVDLGEYQDEYVHKLRMLIDAKVEGREIVTPPGEEEPVVVNLMDALKASLEKANKRSRSQPCGQAGQEARGQPSFGGRQETQNVLSTESHFAKTPQGWP